MASHNAHSLRVAIPLNIEMFQSHQNKKSNARKLPLGIALSMQAQKVLAKQILREINQFDQKMMQFVVLLVILHSNLREQQLTKRTSLITDQGILN